MGVPLPSSCGDENSRVQLARPLDSPLLRLDDREAAELRARAGDDAALERAGERRVLLHERFGQQVVEPVLGHARDDEILVGADPHAAVAISVGQPRQLDQVDAVHAAHGHAAADVEQARLLLRVHAHVVTAEGRGQLAAGLLQREVGPLVQRGAEAFGPEFLGQVAHPGQPPVLTVPQLAEHTGRHPGTIRPPGRAG